MRKIALINIKGGVAKTTSAVNLAAALQKAGRSVLVVDVDPQASASSAVGLNPDDIEKHVLHLLDDTATVSDVRRRLDTGFDIVPAHIELAGAELQIAGFDDRERRLRYAVDAVNGYDYVLYDCPPSVGLLTINALTASDEVIIPTTPGFFSMAGMQILRDTVALIRKRLQPKLRITGVVITMYDNRLNLHRQAVEAIREYFGDIVYTTHIRHNVSLAEAPGHGQTIFEYAPGSYGATDYSELAQEVITQEKGNEQK